MHESNDSTIAAHIRGAALRAEDEWTRALRDRVAPHLPGHEIGERLGRGGMGVVFRARQADLGREVAVKVLEPPPSDRGAWSERFEREARALAKLQHPGIVAIHGFGETDDVAWIVMELVEGASLRSLMDAGALAPEEALAIAPDLCAALAYAHERGIVHRDVKPENVLVDVEGRVKLVDFGIAKLTEDEVGTRLTRTHQAMGTLRYMAPEQLDTPQRVDHRADIYSLGVVLYEMLTGVVPQGVIAPPSKRVEVDVRVDEVVLRSLEREPEHRYQRVADLAARVEAIVGERAPFEPPPVTSTALRREFRSGLRNDFAVLITFVALAATIGKDAAVALDRVDAMSILGVGFVGLLALAPVYALLRGPNKGGVPVSVVRFVTPFLMLGFAVTWSVLLEKGVLEQGDREAFTRETIVLATRCANAIVIVSLLPFLTAAAGTLVARRPVWGPRTQECIRWLGALLCVVTAVVSFPAWTDPYRRAQVVFVLLFLGVGFAVGLPVERQRASRSPHRRAIAFAATGIVGLLVMMVALTPDADLRVEGDPSLSYAAAIVLAALGGFAGIGSPRDAPDPPRRPAG